MLKKPRVKYIAEAISTTSDTILPYTGYLNTRMEVSAGKIIRLEISMVPKPIWESPSPIMEWRFKTKLTPSGVERHITLVNQYYLVIDKLF